MKISLKVLFIFVMMTVLFLQPQEVSAACPTTISWSGINWKKSIGAGPGSAMTGFVFDSCNVTSDSAGRLILKLVKVGSVWKGAEISTTSSRSFGTYYIQVYSSLGTLPASVVFGFFPYKGYQYDGTNEIDIEYGQWGNFSANNWNYTVYPATTSGVKASKTFGFSTPLSTTHTFTWTQKSIKFQSYTGIKTPPFLSTPFASWNYAPKNYLREIPQSSLPLLINLWAHNSGKMGNATSYTVILSKVAIP